ncbi:SOS response-associated peptidase [uncultured Roseovarius sp.]|uniref:SOS response-associated peptidase n=1 Tax=uncultured Roseovarius sp. TaxID=293344 RepID=UPI00262E1E72|nr:SOS response-associated peptidase [uncultured Roseovarius sp.]
MCGRFVITLPQDAMARLFGAAPDNDLPGAPDYNVCPTTRIAVVRQGPNGQRRLSALRWGFLPSWYDTPTDGPLLINARAETIADKPAFREAARSRRCLIPATGFYEWTRDADTRLPWFIQRRDGAPLALAGIWQSWTRGPDTLETCAIVTCAANETMSRLHHRMPVILDSDDWPLWLGEAGHGAARLMRPASEDMLEMWRVTPRVNSNRATGADLIDPIDGETGA